MSKAQEIGQALKKTLEQQNGLRQSGQPRLSEAQIKSLTTFQSRFDTKDRIFKAYSPAHWAYVVANADRCVTETTITLKQLDMAYGEGTARDLVADQIHGIYKSTNTREPLRQDALTQNAEMFVAKYGHECTLNSMMLYFANYPLEYKSSYGQFDMLDILQQFGKKFLPWWRMKQEPERPREQVSGRATGKDGLIRYLANELLDGKTIEQVKEESGMYRLGMLTDDDIAKAVEVAQNEF